MSEESLSSLRDLNKGMKFLLESQNNMSNQLREIHLKLVGSEYNPTGLILETENNKKKIEDYREEMKALIELVDEKFEKKTSIYDGIIDKFKLLFKIGAFLASVISLKFLIDLGKWINTHIL